MKILFLGGIFAEINEPEIIRKSRGAVEYSANIFQKKLLNGFKLANYDIDVISAPFIGPYPNVYKDMWFDGFECEQESYQYVHFCNIWGIRNYSRYNAIKKSLTAFIDFEDTEKLIIVYSVHTPFLQAAAYAKRMDPRIKICLIVLDLPQYMNLAENKSLIYRIGKACDIQKFYRYNKFVDSYVLLTEHMKEKLDIQGRPYIKLEGIVDRSEIEQTISYTPVAGEKKILYAGKLNVKFGVKTLVEAFDLISDSNLKLIVCGKGDLDSFLIRKSKEDIRIDYRGQVTPKEVKELISTVDLLVNPRPNNEEYTKYSFPSKNIEYLLSGRPVLGYKLDGMPNCYGEYMYFVQENRSSKSDAENLAEAVINALNILEYNNRPFVEYAKEFLASDVVASKIVALSFPDILCKHNE